MTGGRSSGASAAVGGAFVPSFRHGRDGNCGRQSYGALLGQPEPPAAARWDSRLLWAGTVQPCSVRGAHGTSPPVLEWRLSEVPASSLRCGGSRGALKEFCQRR